MYNPMMHALHLQQGALRNLYCLSQMYAEGWFQIMGQSAETFQSALGRRGEDLHVPPKVLPSGADLLDHYGHRASDVDVEHDL